MPTDLESVIETAVEDSLDQPEVETEVETSTEEAQEATSEATGDEKADSPEGEVEGEEKEPSQAKSEAQKAKPEADDFEKKFGIQKETVLGRENRIPYSRVKKIVEKAVNEARAEATKATETPLTAKVTEYESKVKDYEGRLEKVAQFEQVMVNEAEKFLTMLNTLPQYQKLLAPLFNPAAAPIVAQPEGKKEEAVDEMPQPDQELTDGSKVYSMEGLRKLMDWQARQVETRITKQVEDKYKPIEKSWQEQQEAKKAQA